MSPEEAKKIILDQEEEESKQIFEKKIIRREILPQINSSLVAPNAFLITGVRRCGKSTLAIQVAEQHSYARVNFDDERLSGLIPRDLNNILEAVYTLHGDVKVLVTGSNSSLMSREFGTRLTGRHLDFTLFPFSFREFISYKGFVFEESTKGIAKAKKYLEEYMSIGGFPEVLLFGTQVLKSIMNDIILKDIVLRYGIRNE